jgi:hypothetical protein
MKPANVKPSLSMKKRARLEDEPKVLIYVDVLGFEALTNEYQFRVREFHHKRFSGASTTEMQNQFNRFNTVLDQCVFEETLYGGIQAMLFSDCAFLVFDNSLRATVIAVGLMRNFINRGVPVRMGLGKGTFYDIEYLTKTDVGAVTLSKSRFVGTSVVRAHSAEQCGGKGMRIFLDSSIENDLPHIRQRIKTLPLARPLRGVNWELDYLNESRPIAQEQKVEADDRKLFDNVARMKQPSWPRDVQRHYTQTLAALNRMRKANSRKLVNLRKLPYGQVIIW